MREGEGNSLYSQVVISHPLDHATHIDCMKNVRGLVAVIVDYYLVGSVYGVVGSVSWLVVSLFAEMWWRSVAQLQMQATLTV